MSDTPLKTNEQAALVIGGQAAGAYLEQISQFDLRKLTSEQWAVFCATLFQATCSDLEKQADDKIPF